MKKSIIAVLTLFLIVVLIMAFDITGQKFKFGETTLHDSTNYTTLNRSFRIKDSLMVNRDAIIKGSVYLDTNRQFKIYASGNNMILANNKTNGYMYYYAGLSTAGHSWNKGGFSYSTEMMSLDSVNGLKVYYGGITLDPNFHPTQELKIIGDTASDYDGNDQITLNRQSGILTTKSLTTAAGADYTLTWNNSIFTDNAKVFAMMRTNAGNGDALVRNCSVSGGACTIIIRNIHASASFNAAVSLQIFVINSP